MRNIVALLVLTLLLAAPRVCDASYLIKLKNGREFVTSRYWEEGSQIKFYSYGGIIGVDKNLVSGIEESDRLYEEYKEEKKVVQPKSAEKPETDAKADAFSKEPKKAPVSQEPPKKDEEIVQEFRSLQKRFGQINDLTQDDVYRLSDDLGRFRERVAKGNSAENHKDELEGATTLLRAVEGLIKARRQ